MRTPDTFVVFRDLFYDADELRILHKGGKVRIGKIDHNGFFLVVRPRLLFLLRDPDLLSDVLDRTVRSARQRIKARGIAIEKFLQKALVDRDAKLIQPKRHDLPVVPLVEHHRIDGKQAEKPCVFKVVA